MKNEKQKVYLCGTITKDAKYKMKFARAETRLTDAGYEVCNPVNLCIEKMTWSECMRICIGALVTCDAIFLVDDLTNSEGGQLEKHIAEKIGIKFI